MSKKKSSGSPLNPNRSAEGEGKSGEGLSAQRARVYVDMTGLNIEQQRTLFGQLVRAIFEAPVNYVMPIQLMRNWPPAVASADSRKLRRRGPRSKGLPGEGE